MRSRWRSLKAGQLLVRVALVVLLVALVVTELFLAPVAGFWSGHPMTGAVASAVITLLATVFVFQEVLARQERRRQEGLNGLAHDSLYREVERLRRSYRAYVRGELILAQVPGAKSVPVMQAQGLVLLAGLPRLNNGRRRSRCSAWGSPGGLRVRLAAAPPNASAH